MNHAIFYKCSTFNSAQWNTIVLRYKCFLKFSHKLQAFKGLFILFKSTFLIAIKHNYLFVYILLDKWLNVINSLIYSLMVNIMLRCWRPLQISLGSKVQALGLQTYKASVRPLSATMTHNPFWFHQWVNQNIALFIQPHLSVSYFIDYKQTNDSVWPSVHDPYPSDGYKSMTVHPFTVIANVWAY